MWTFARIAETMDVKLCNINLRLLTVHSYLQEQYTGPIMHTTEFWIERDIQGYKASVRDRVVAAPEMFMAHSYLIGCAVSEAKTKGVTDAYELFQSTSGRVKKSHDDTKPYAHFTGTCEAMPLKDFTSNMLGPFLRKEDGYFAGICGDKQVRDEVQVMRFKSAKVGDEEIRSRAYTRTKTRLAYNISFTEGDKLSFGKVLCYYRLSHRDKYFRFL